MTNNISEAGNQFRRNIEEMKRLVDKIQRNANLFAGTAFILGALAGSLITRWILTGGPTS